MQGPPLFGDEVAINLGGLDATDQLVPTYELWTIRREAWLPPFPVSRPSERDQHLTGAARGCAGFDPA